MTAPGSIRWRLMMAGAAAIAAALLVAAFGLAYLFDRHGQRVVVADLTARALSVAAMVEPDAAGGPAFRKAPGDPLYDQPFSGHYWQAELAGEMRRSRSLWDYTLPLPTADLAPGETRVLTLPGPTGEALLALEQQFTVGKVPLRVVVATNRSELERARAGFLSDLLPYLALLGGLLLAGSLAQVIVGLKPLSQISAQVAALRSGAQPRMGQNLPQEVQPLAAEINQLLDDRDAELARARHRASDLAHGFKTPLQALLGDAQQLRDRGAADLADSVETVATAMRRLVDRELARARIQSDRRKASAAPAQVLARVQGVLQRTPAGAALDWTLDAPPDLRARIDVDDLTEALGALAENAVRHARSRVSLRSMATAQGVVILVEDDGPGVPQAQLARLVQRGVRLDESGEGQGMGLAIVAEIVDAAGGSLQFETLNPGFRATLLLAAGQS